MKISQRIHKLAESATIAVSNKSAEMKAAGIDVISLGAGEPDFDTPAHIKEAAWRALQRGETKYAKPASGTIELKQAIVDKFRSDNGLDYELSQVLATVGAKEAIGLAFGCLLDPGDEVILPAPYWVSYPEQIKLAGGVPVIIETDVRSGYKISPVQLQSALTPRTRAFVLNSPSNPSGAAYDADEVAALARVLETHGDITVISDEIYDQFVYGGREHCSFAAVSRHAYEHTLTVNGGSKTFSMTGWRIGFAGGPAELIRAMAKLQSQTTSGAATFSMHALAVALTEQQTCVEDMKSEFQRRVRYLHQRLNDIDGFVCPEPEGAIFVFPDVSATYRRLDVSGSVEWATRLLGEAHVALVPGAAFGADKCVRFSFATSMSQLEEGLDRVARFVK